MASDGSSSGQRRDVLSSFFARVSAGSYQMSSSPQATPTGRSSSSGPNDVSFQQPRFNNGVTSLTPDPAGGSATPGSMTLDDPEDPFSGLDSGGGDESQVSSQRPGSPSTAFGKIAIDLALQGSRALVLATGSSTRAAKTGTVTAGKRAASLLQYADREIVAKKLKGTTRDEYKKWCTAPPDEREAAVGALLFSIKDTLATGGIGGAVAGSQGPGTVWLAPDKVIRNINKYAIRLILSPNLPEYDREGIVRTLMGIVEKKCWGLPANLRQQDEDKWDMLTTAARNALTQRKSEIKKALLHSMGIDPKTGKSSTMTSRAHKAVDGKLHIYDICKQLTTALGSKSQINTNLTITVEMCIRVAFLRFCARNFIVDPTAEEPETKELKNYAGRFWAFVDHNLRAFRYESRDPPETGNMNRLKLHQLFVGTLIEDQALFPSPSSSSHRDVFTSLKEVIPTDLQGNLDQYVLTGRAEALSTMEE